MTWINQTGERHGATGSGPRPVHTPGPRDGLGDALRTAYLPRANDLPHEIGDLLDQLR